MTQFLERIDVQLGAERDDFKLAELLAKKAAYLGRIGKCDEANEIIRFVRQSFNDGRSGRVTCFLLLAEGILLHHAFQNQAALDKFNRASLLAQGSRQTDLIGICAAWKGFIDFDLSRFESMRRSLLSIKDLGLDADHAVQSRLAVTMMTGCLLLGEREYAKKWFHFGHSHAVAEGDLACIDGLLFNRAVFGLARQRVDWCFDRFDPEWARLIRAELSSARNLQNLVGITTMRDHIDLCVARLDLLEGRYQSSAETLSNLRILDRFATKHVNQTALEIDLLFISGSLGQVDDLHSRLNAIDLGEVAALDPDERLVALTQLHRVVQLALDNGRAHDFADELRLAQVEYVAYENQIRDAIQSLMET